jgi:UDP-2-acetamido-3-amino-2,3-dideoxy-glucuronate N-acetyltransferase
LAKNVVVVGTGYWGKNLVRNFHELDALYGICDVDERALKPFKDRYPEITTFTNLKALLQDPAVAAVVVSTPAKTHYALAKEALIAGKDVFVEKPIALTYKEGSELVALAEEKKRILMVGHILEYHPAVAKLKELIDAGELGDIQYIYSNRLNLGKIRTEENILWSFAPHDISVILYLLNEMPEKVAAHGGNYLNPHIADVTISTMNFPSGAKAHIFVSWLHPYKEQKLVIVGSKKMMVFDDVNPQNKLLAYNHKIDWAGDLPVPRPEDALPVEIEKREPLKSECRHFLECVADRKTPQTSGLKGLKVLQVLEACQESLKQNGKEISLMSTESKKNFFVHSLAVVDENVEIGEGTKIWHFSHVQSGAKIGKKCVLGQNVNVGNNVIIGDFVKIQNNVSIYEGVTLEDYVFCGPSMVFTNITDPRSKYPQVGASFYKKTLVKEGASIGANSTIVCGHTIGRFAFVGAGAVVTKDVSDFALVVGNPARITGWMSEAGEKLKFDAAGFALCPRSGRKYHLVDGSVRDITEE